MLLILYLLMEVRIVSAECKLNTKRKKAKERTAERGGGVHC